MRTTFLRSTAVRPKGDAFSGCPASAHFRRVQHHHPQAPGLAIPEAAANRGGSLCECTPRGLGLHQQSHSQDPQVLEQTPGKDLMQTGARGWLGRAGCALRAAAVTDLGGGSRLFTLAPRQWCCRDTLCSQALPGTVQPDWETEGSDQPALRLAISPCGCPGSLRPTLQWPFTNADVPFL